MLHKTSYDQQCQILKCSVRGEINEAPTLHKGFPPLVFSLHLDFEIIIAIAGEQLQVGPV